MKENSLCEVSNNKVPNNDVLLEKIKDPKFYLENFCKIKGKNGGLIPFVLNEAQKDFYNTLKTNDRIIILKSRQIGFSTAAVGYLYHLTITTPGVTTALIGYNSALTAELLDKIKTFYRTTPKGIRPTIQYNSKSEISFPAMGSKILVLPSSDNVGRGYTLNFILCTELAFWEKAEEKMTALENSVPPRGGKIIIESTPNGTGNQYHRTWCGDNDYVKKRYGWWWNYTEEDIEIIRKRMNNPRKFAQEYGCEFLTSGRGVFDGTIMEEQRKNLLKIGEKVVLQDGSEYVVTEDRDGLICYKPPERGSIYVIGADVSEGIGIGDYSVAIIWDRMTGEQVGFFRGKLPPDVFGEKLDAWGRTYNMALMVVEINNHGLSTVNSLKQKMYPNMYFRPSKLDAISQGYTDRIGWKTTRVTRELLIDDFAQAMRDRLLIIRSENILDEMSTFVYDNSNSPTAQEGYHDDCIFAGGIGFQGFKTIYNKPLTQIDYSEHLPLGYNY